MDGAVQNIAVWVGIASGAITLVGFAIQNRRLALIGLAFIVIAAAGYGLATYVVSIAKSTRTTPQILFYLIFGLSILGAGFLVRRLLRR